MEHVLELVVSWVVSTALLFVVIIIDERRFLNEEQLERAWPPSSRDAAIVAFGAIALLIHFIKTRGHVKNARGILGIFLGFAFGIIGLVVVSLLTNVIVFAVLRLAGYPVEF